MGTNYSKHYSTKKTPQSEPIPGTTQVKNSAGGHAWAVDDWKRLDRFLILGSDGGSYYASERKLTIETANAVVKCIGSNGKRVVDRVVEISEAGRAPKNDPALFVLALAASASGFRDASDVRRYALNALPRVARMSTHLFIFVDYVTSLRGWGRGLRSAVASWYDSKDIGKLSYQICKYRQRGGYSHRDLLRLAHPSDIANQPVYRFITKDVVMDGCPELIYDFTRLQDAENEKAAFGIINGNQNISWEMVPTQFLGSPDIWSALLPNLPMTAMIRNLGRMTANGLVKPMSAASKVIVEKLSNVDAIKKARVHPIAVLAALATYSSGHGARGTLAWTPVQQVVDALDKAFYISFGNVEPSGKRTVLALDVSGSMSWGEIAGIPGLTPKMASAAMALITASTESEHVITAFSHEMVKVNISPRMRLDSVMKDIGRLPFGRTDCALPMLWALKNKVNVDTFVIYTDSETWAGDMHPSQALQKYRQSTGIPARLVVVGMVSNGFTIANPNDGGMMDVVGFDTATPGVISSFSSGKL